MGHRASIAEAIRQLVCTDPPQPTHPLLLPTNLREVLRLVGRLTTEIAETLEDGKVDAQEAERLLDLLDSLDQLTEHLRVDLTAVLKRQ